MSPARRHEDDFFRDEDYSLVGNATAGPSASLLESTVSLFRFQLTDATCYSRLVTIGTRPFYDAFNTDLLIFLISLQSVKPSSTTWYHDQS